MAKTFLVSRDQTPVIIWLLVCMLLVASMVTLGGYTRLSGSGLSIAEWKPVTGTLPPRDDAQWEQEFSTYKETPQYKKVNSEITLQEFKTIYWPEYFHRLLGRLIGFAVLIPFAIFLARKSLSRSVIMHIGGIFLLGALQGFVGWFMVKSGLIDNPHVSHIRLALHLSLALTIFGLLEWLWLDVMTEHFWWKEKPPAAAMSSVDPLSSFIIWFFFFCLQILFGAFMAGLHAGFAYNTWPTMNGKWLPESFVGDIELIQFVHRWLAAVVFGGFFIWWSVCRKYVINTRLEIVCMAIGILLAIQFYLGVLTLINAVPLDYALSHQLCALALFAGSIYMLHRIVVEMRS